MSLVMTFAMQDFVVMSGDNRRTWVVDEGEYYDDTPKVFQISPQVLCGFTGDVDVTTLLRKELEGVNPKATIEAVARKIRKAVSGIQDGYQTVSIAGRSDTGKMSIIQLTHRNNFRIEKVRLEKGQLEWRFCIAYENPTEFVRERVLQLTEFNAESISQLAREASEKISETDALVSKKCDVLSIELGCTYGGDKMQTIEQLKRDVEELRQKVCQDRIARGVPEEPPEDFVSEAMTSVLIERCKPLFQYVAKYTQLCSDGNRVLPANVEIFERYADYLTLIRNSKSRQSFFAMGMNTAKNYMSEADQYSDASEYVRRLGMALSLAKLGFEMTIDQATYNHRISAEMRKEAEAEYKRLKADEAFLIAEVHRYMQHYESIKHLF